MASVGWKLFKRQLSVTARIFRGSEAIDCQGQSQTVHLKSCSASESVRSPDASKDEDAGEDH